MQYLTIGLIFLEFKTQAYRTNLQSTPVLNKDHVVATNIEDNLKIKISQKPLKNLRNHLKIFFKSNNIFMM